MTICWNPQSLILLDSEANRSYLSVEIKLIGTPGKMVFTNVYRPQRIEENIKLLQDPRRIKRREGHLPCIVGGDINMITSLLEKKHGQRRIDKYSESFKEFIEETNLIDMETVNGCFTCSNKRGGKHQVASRLHRFLI